MKHLRRAIQRLLRMNSTKKERAKKPALVLGKVDLTVKIPKTYQHAATSLVDWSVINHVGHDQRLVKTSRHGMHPRMVEFYLKFSNQLECRGIPMYAFEFYRSPERQNRLKEQGVSKAGAGSSPHQYGCAVDIIHSTKLWDITEKQWAVIGAIGKEVARKMNLKVVWGGDWGFYDPAHWELANWREYRHFGGVQPFRTNKSYMMLCAEIEPYYQPDDYGWYMLWVEQQLLKQKKIARGQGK